MPLPLEADSQKRLSTIGLDRSKFLTKSSLGQNEEQGITRGILETQLANTRQDQELIARKKEAEQQRILEERRLGLMKKQIDQEKKMMQQQSLSQWFGPIGGIIGWAKD